MNRWIAVLQLTVLAVCLTGTAVAATVKVEADHRTGKVAWQGVVSDALADTPEQADRRTAQAVEKLLRKFPVSGGGR